MGVPPATGPVWTEEDRAVVLAWHAYQESLCALCGNPRDVCHAKELDGELYGQVQVCHVTAARERVRKREWDRFKGQASDDVEVETAGAYVAVYQRDPAVTIA